jgi:hypothetical protein
MNGSLSTKRWDLRLRGEMTEELRVTRNKPLELKKALSVSPSLGVPDYR